jgi:outer membrane immunogenic protein
MAMIASAQAANLSAPAVKEAAYTPPPYIWSGFYVGANGGYAWQEGRVSVLPIECVDGWAEARNDRDTVEGGFGGGQIGFNIQRDRLVFGLEADAQGAGVSGSARNDLRTEYGPWGRQFDSASTQLDWFATFRGRLGLVPYENWLVYITGGVAFGGIQDKLNHRLDSDGRIFEVSRDDTYVGYVLGAGVEYGFSPAWSIKFEYQFMDLGFTRLRQWDHNCDCNPFEFDSGHSFNTARVGINYHFVPQYVPLK